MNKNLLGIYARRVASSDIEGDAVSKIRCLEQKRH